MNLQQTLCTARWPLEIKFNCSFLTGPFLVVFKQKAIHSLANRSATRFRKSLDSSVYAAMVTAVHFDVFELLSRRHKKWEC